MTTVFCELDCATSISVAGAAQPSIFACKSEAVDQAELFPCQGDVEVANQVCGLRLLNSVAPSGIQCQRSLTATLCVTLESAIPCFKEDAKITTTTTSSVPESPKSPIVPQPSAIPTSAIGNTFSGLPTFSPATPSISATDAIPTNTSFPSSPSITTNGTVSIQGKHASKQQGISSGAAAGIGIGGAIAGAAIAGLILLFLFGRYKKRRQQIQPNSFASHLPNYNSDLGRQEKGMTTPSKNTAIVTELPQPAEDDAIIGQLSRLRDNIKNHVQSFYTTGQVNPQTMNHNLLGQVAQATGVQVPKLQSLLAIPTSRMATLRLCVAWIVLSRCDGRGPVSNSLLPEEAASVASIITGIDYQDSRKAALAIKLKVISGSLLQSRPGQAQPFQSANLEHKIEQTVLAANEFLTPFIDSMADANSDKRLRNLESIVRRATQLAMLLFSQPSSWAFEFNRSGTAQGTIVVFPGLLETVNEDGIVQQPPRQFYQPEVSVAV